MTWVRVDDDMPWHRKFRKAGDLRALCLALDLTGMCHCAKYSTDGLVADVDLPGVLDIIPKARRKTVLGVLVDIGRWDRDDELGGYWVRNYLKYNPSAKAAEADRAKRAEATRKWREKHRGNASRDSHAEGGDGSVMHSGDEPVIKRDTVPSPGGYREPERQLSVTPPVTDPSPDPADAPPSPSPSGADSASATPQRCRHGNDPATCGICSTAVGVPPATRLSASLRQPRATKDPDP